MVDLKRILMLVCLLGLSATAARAGDYERVARRNFWNETQNAAGLRADSVTISFAEVHGGSEQGDFRDFSQPSTRWDVGADARTITHFDKISLAGAFKFDHAASYDACGSMLSLPGFYPVDVLEFTPGRKDRQTYAFAGGFSADIAPGWRIGAGIDFSAMNYVKRKDLRHTNYRLDMSVSPGFMYSAGTISFGLNYIFRKNSETATAEVEGSSVANYYAFLDKGLMYGAYELWSGSGVHLSDSGVSGFPLSEMSHGAGLQFSAGEFFISAEYLYGKGKGGEKTSIWYEFPSHRVSAFAGYRFVRPRGDHFVRLYFDWFRQFNNENVLGQETENGVTLNQVYGTNRIFERSLIAFRPEYEWVGERMEFRAGGELYSYNRLSSLMYPYMYAQEMLSGRVFGSALVRVGRFDLGLGLSWYGGGFSEDEGGAASDVTVGEPPFQYAEYYNLQNEYYTAPRTDLKASVRFNFSIGLYIEAAAEWTHAFKLEYIGGNNRVGEVLKFGYIF